MSPSPTSPSADPVTPLRLSHVSLETDDIVGAVDFYTRVLGCQIAHEFRNPAGEIYGVFLACGGGSFIELFRCRESRPRGGPLRHFCLQVADIQKTSNALKLHGFAPEIRRGRSDRTLQLEIQGFEGVMVEFHQYDTDSTLHPWRAERDDSPQGETRC